MQLILKEDVGKLGRAGDLVQVKNGYGRNYLIPQGLAVLATPRNVKQLGHQKRIMTGRIEKVRKEALSLADKIEGRALTFERQSGDKDRLFGSVTSKDVVAGLSQLGIEVQSRNVEMERPIKQLGIFPVAIRLHTDIRREIKVWVVAKP